MQDNAAGSSNSSIGIDEDYLDIDAFFLPGGILNDVEDDPPPRDGDGARNKGATATVLAPQPPASASVGRSSRANGDNHRHGGSEKALSSCCGSADLAAPSAAATATTTLLPTAAATAPAGLVSLTNSAPSSQQPHQSSPVPVNPWDETAAAAAAAAPPANLLNQQHTSSSIQDLMAEAQLVPDAKNNNNDAVKRCAESDDISSWLLQSSNSMSNGLLLEISSGHHSNSSCSSNRGTGLELQEVDHFNDSNNNASGSWAATTYNSKTLPPVVPKPPPGFEGVVAVMEKSESSSLYLGGVPNPEERARSTATMAGTGGSFGMTGSIDDPAHTFRPTGKMDAAAKETLVSVGATTTSVHKSKIDPPGRAGPRDHQSSQQSPDFGGKVDIQNPAFENKRTIDPSERTRSASQDPSNGFLRTGSAGAATANSESLVVRPEKSLAESSHSSNNSKSGSKRKKKNKPSALPSHTDQDSTTTNRSEFHVNHHHHRTGPPTASPSAGQHAKAHIAAGIPQVEESLLQAIFNVFAAIVAGIFQTSPAAALAWVVEMYKALIDPMVQSALGAAVLLVKYAVICCFALSNVFKYAFEEAALDHHVSRLINPTRQSQHHERQTVSFSCYIVLYLSPFLGDILMSNMDCPHYMPHIISNVALYVLSMRLTRLSSIDYASGAPAKRGKPSINDNNGVTTASAKSSTYIPESDRRQLEYDFCHRILRSLRYAIPCSFVLEGFSDVNASFAMADAPVRLVLAYLLSLVRHGLLLSPVAWIGWSTQILLAAYLPGGFLLDLFLVVVGLAFIRLVSTLHHEQRRF